MSDWLETARGLLEQPTAPLFEELPRAHVRSIAAEAGLDVSEDAAGNLLVRYDGAGADASAPLVLVAHLDHPGFAVDRTDGTTAHLEFRGGLSTTAAAPGSPLQFFAPGDAAPTGEGVLEEALGEGRLAGALATLTAGEAPPGGFAMWGFDGWIDDPERIRGRVCDDLVGAAAALCVLVDLAAERPPGVAAWGLFTRAEEIGFLGTLEAIRLGVVPRGAAVLSLECSKALPGAPQGDGVIVRVGDRMSIFDPGLTAALAAAAAEVAARHDGFRFQRRLMDGGACEATAFCAAGYRASGLALPLGNYHNADDGGSGVAPEHVAVDDFTAEVRLLAELARRPDLLVPEAGPPAWLAERTEEARRMLGAPR